MKRLILLIITVVMSVFAVHAQEINFLRQDWAGARAKAKKEHKYILMDAYTDWCYWCKVMDKKTFPDPDVSKFIKENFIAVKMNMEKDTGILIAQKYRVRGYPTFLIFNPDGKLVYRVFGYEQPQPYLATLKDALQPASQFDAPGDPNNLEPGFPDFYKNMYIKGKQKRPDSATVNGFLDKQKDLMSEVSWSVMDIFPVNEKYQQWIIDHRTELNKHFGAAEVDSRIQSIASHVMSNAIQHKDTAVLSKAVYYARLGDPQNAKLYDSYLHLKYYEGLQDWPNYMKYAERYIQMTGTGNSSAINEISWKIYNRVDNPEYIKKALSWMAIVVEQDPQYAYMDTYAALLYKSGQLEQAKKYAEKAIAIGKESSQNVQTTEKLLGEINQKLNAKSK